MTQTTTIGATVIVTGEVTSQEDITVHGTVKGKIHMESGALRVAQQGRVDAEVRGSSVTIDGSLEGSVTAAARVELTPSAKVNGTLTTPAVVLQDGASFNGIIDMDRQGKGKNPAGLKIAETKTAAQAG
jgi:cytoskeletal protein CcmA (bactofilin family)